MTLIECYDRTVLENIAGTLYLHPDKVIVVGDGEKMRGLPQRFAPLLEKRRMGTRVELCDIGGMSITQITERLLKLVASEPDCVIDLTGGDEPVILAVGAMLCQLPGKKPAIQKFDLATNVPMDCDGDGQTLPGSRVSLSVQELIALHGGIVHPLSYQPPSHVTPRDLDGLWRIVADDPHGWNDKMAVLGQFEKRSEDKFDLEIYRSRLGSEVKDFQIKDKQFQALLEQFDRRGVVRDRSDRQVYRYSYRSELMRHCTRKAGNMLETKVLLEARAQTDNAKPYFDDCMMGVSIDWDGTVHYRKDGPADTNNEMDLVLTRGLRSLFISCKNGSIDESELYKLHTVAQRFGGPEARKLLIATDLTFKNPAARRAFVQRARDMNIHLETDAGELTSPEWTRLFQTVMK